MKYRTDFVTNSSSSSFIFGKPNGNTITIDDARDFIKDSAKRLLYIIEYLDKEAYKISGVCGLLKKLRRLDEDDYKLKFLIHEHLYHSRIFQYKVKSIFKRFGIEITDDGSIRCDAREGNYIPYYYFLCYYTDIRDIKWLKAIIRGSYDSMFDFVDFRKCDWDWEIDGIVSYYGEDLMHKNYDVSSCHKVAYEYLGEVALLGDDPCLPILLAWYLYCKLDYACMHMG